MAITAPGRAAEGYSKEVFGATDPAALPPGVMQYAPVQVGGPTLPEIFTAILAELRSINANVVALKEPMGVNTDLRLTA